MTLITIVRIVVPRASINLAQSFSVGDGRAQKATQQISISSIETISFIIDDCTLLTLCWSATQLVHA
eukprot:6078898-Amphidinium_carterae.2